MAVQPAATTRPDPLSSDPVATRATRRAVHTEPPDFAPVGTHARERALSLVSRRARPPLAAAVLAALLRSWRLVLVLVALLACADLLFRNVGLTSLVLCLAVVLTAAAALAAERAAVKAVKLDSTADAQRWHAMALAGLLGTLALIGQSLASGVDAPPNLPLLLLPLPVALIGLTHQQTGLWTTRSLLVALDVCIVASSVGLGSTALVWPIQPNETYGLVLLGLFSGAGFACLLTHRSAVRLSAGSRDTWILLGVGGWCLFGLGSAAEALAWPLLPAAASPGVALLASLFCLRAAWLRPSRQADAAQPADSFSRVRLLPGVLTAATIAGLTLNELIGAGNRAGFLSVITLFGLVIARLLFTLTENRHLLQRVELSGVFEENLHSLGVSMLDAMDRQQALSLACRTAQVAVGADSVLLWMLDDATRELEAVEVLSSKRRSLLYRRMPVEDPVSLAARVARTAESEIIAVGASQDASNGFLNVILRAQSLLAVPVIRSQTVHGVLVCVSTQGQNAYGASELGKAELLASQVAVALDNAYQHDLQRRRVDELESLYQFARSAHAAGSPAEIVRQILPILRERLHYTYAAVWVRDADGGRLMLVGGDAPGGVPLTGGLPSDLARLAFSSGEPVHAGLGWSSIDEGRSPHRHGVRSQLSVPMVLNKRVVGVVDLESRQPNAYSLNDERLLVSLANHAALAIDNLRLVQEARNVEALRELDRMKTELLGTVSHELRSPLASIKGYASTMLRHEDQLPAEEKREYLEIIDSEADRLRELIENFLDLSRLEAGVLRVERAPIKLGDKAHEVTRKVQLASELHDVVCEWTEDPVVMADKNRVYQIIQNLLTNAIKYSPRGGRITLASRIVNRELLISIHDEGLGMPPSELVRIFDRFHRVRGSATQGIGGTGLGLAICKGLVDAHGGRIWAESEGEGRGSTFTFTLPLSTLQSEKSGSYGHDD